MSKRRQRHASNPLQVIRARAARAGALVYGRVRGGATRQCDYCPADSDPVPKRFLTKLPNGLFICPGHPRAKEREKLAKITTAE